MIVSHFVPGGHISGTSFGKSWHYTSFQKQIGILNRTYLDGVIAALPIYVGISFKPVFITAIGHNVPDRYQGLFFPFMEVLIPCAGFSLTILSGTSHFSIILFEYNLDVCVFGFLKGQRF